MSKGNNFDTGKRRTTGTNFGRTAAAATFTRRSKRNYGRSSSVVG